MKVWPKNDSVRKTLKHPSGSAFREEGPGDWPDDSFTYRRILDGDVLKEDPESASVVKAAPKKSTVDKGE